MLLIVEKILPLIVFEENQSRQVVDNGAQEYPFLAESLFGLLAFPNVTSDTYNSGDSTVTVDNRNFGGKMPSLFTESPVKSHFLLVLESLTDLHNRLIVFGVLRCQFFGV